MTISAIIITKNEEANIERCLTSLAFADEIIVVDAESTDATVPKARRFTTKVFVRPWPGYGAQKNFGASQATSDWLLFIDADEEVPPQLAQAITTTLTSSNKDFYWLRIVTVFLGKPLRHLFGHNPRLFRRQRGQWTEQHVHEQVKRSSGSYSRSTTELGLGALKPRTEGHAFTSQAQWPSGAGVDHLIEQVTITLGDEHSGVITTPLLHHSHPTVASYLATMHEYTTLDARHMAETGRHRSGRPMLPSALLPYRLALRQFLKLLFYRRGLLDGPAGWVWCALSARYEFEMARKYLEYV